MALPSFIALKYLDESKYLSYINEDPQLHGYLQSSGTKVWTPFTKFEVEVAKTQKDCVHIRSCYNNKYWRRLSESSWWIVAEADEPEEDESKWSCTLFKPDVDSAAKNVRLLHVQLGHYAYIVTEDNMASCLFAGVTPTDDDFFKFIDWEWLFPLPIHVAFKDASDNDMPDINGDYLIPMKAQNGLYYLQFVPGISNSDPKVANQVFTNDDGSVAIKSDSVDKFWKRFNSTDNWIMVDSAHYSNEEPDTLFWPIKINNNIVALRNLGNNMYCGRYSAKIKNCLAAIFSTKDTAHLEVKEPIKLRKIDNVRFWLKDARFFDTTVVDLVTQEVDNSTQESRFMEVKLPYKITWSSIWNSSVSLKLYSGTNINTDIPVIVEERQIGIPAHINEEYKWGTTRVTTTEEEIVHEVEVGPMTKVKVTLQATVSSCNVPFSYCQHDTLMNEQTVTYDHMDDGIYTITNYYNIEPHVVKL